MLDGITPETGLLVGEALHERGAFVEADEVLTAAEAALAGDDELLVPITEIRTRNLMWGLLRQDEALEVNRRARERMDARAAVEELTLNEALLLSYAGRPADALACLAPLGELRDPRARALCALAEVPALVATGRCVTALDVAGRAFAEQTELPDQIAIPGPEIHVLMQIYALAECGRLAESEALAAAAYEATPSTAPPDALMWLGHQLGRCALLAGRAETARRWLGEALARCEEHDIFGPRRLVLSSLATAYAYLGDAAAAAAAAAALEELDDFPFVRPEQELGRAWALVAAGDLPGARGVLRTAADLAATTGHRGAEAWLRHDVARLGEPASVADRLSELASECEGELVLRLRRPRRGRGRRRPPATRGGGRSVRAARRRAPRGRGRDRGRPGVPASGRRAGGGRSRRAGDEPGRRLRGGPHTRPDRPGHGRPAHPPRARRGVAGGQRRVEQGHRRPAVPLRPDSEQPPPERVRQAGHQRPAPTRRRVGRRGWAQLGRSSSRAPIIMISAVRL